MEESNKIPSALADKLDNFAFPFDENAWTAFESLRDTPRPKPKTPYRFWGLMLLAIATVFALSLYGKKTAIAFENTANSIVTNSK